MDGLKFYVEIGVKKLFLTGLTTDVWRVTAVSFHQKSLVGGGSISISVNVKSFSLWIKECGLGGAMTIVQCWCPAWDIPFERRDKPGTSSVMQNISWNVFVARTDSNLTYKIPKPLLIIQMCRIKLRTFYQNFTGLRKIVALWGLEPRAVLPKFSMLVVLAFALEFMESPAKQ